MLKTGILASVASIALAAGAAQAKMGAPVPAPMQQGAWGNAGWQPNGAPVYAPAPGQPMMAPQAAMPPHAYAAGYRRYDRGQHVPKAYRDHSYVVTNWADWGLAQPAEGVHWARYYDDAVLIDESGMIVDARYGVNWDAPQQPRGYYGQGQAQGYPSYPATPVAPQGYGYGRPGTTVTHVGPHGGSHTVVTTQVYGGAPGYVGGAPGYAGGAGYGYGYSGGGTVIITPGMMTTTTTTTSDETVYRNVWVKQRVWHRPVYRHIVHRAPPTCITGS